MRTHGSDGRVSVDYYTEDVTALSISLDTGESVDYENTRGTVVFESGQLEAQISIEIYPNPFAMDGESFFRVVLVNTTNGLVLHRDQNDTITSHFLSSQGHDWFAYCTVEIFHDEDIADVPNTSTVYKGFVHSPETLYGAHRLNTNNYETQVTVATAPQRAPIALFVMEARETVTPRTISEFALASFDNFQFSSSPVLSYQFVSTPISSSVHSIPYNIPKQGLFTLEVTAT